MPAVTGQFNVIFEKQQCDNAPCVTVCPFGANFHDPATGNVKTDPNRCIGCGYCVTACPYDVRWLHPKTGLPVKCMGEGCEKLTAAGQLPACVSACPAGARSWGDINDPASEISLRAAKGRTERLLPQKGTNPNFIVVVAK